MNYDEIIEFLVREVKKEIEKDKNNMEKNSVLVLIHGGNSELSQILLELEKLSKDYNLEVAYTKYGKNISFDKVSKIVTNQIELSYENVDEVLKDKCLILLPLLTKSSAAKIAYGIRDTEINYLISKAILLNKSIVATYNSCRIEGKSEYINQINLNIEKLKKYGIRFTEANNLTNYVNKIMTKKNIYMINKQSITTKDINEMSDVDLIVSKDTSITSLVYDRARDLNIKIIKE